VSGLIFTLKSKKTLKAMTNFKEPKNLKLFLLKISFFPALAKPV